MIASLWLCLIIVMAGYLGCLWFDLHMEHLKVDVTNYLIKTQEIVLMNEAEVWTSMIVIMID